MTRMQVAGIEAVLPDGSVISHMSGLAKDNTGFDFAQLLCGSEGSLAIITAVRLRLHRPFGRTSLALVGCEDYDDALSVIATAVDGHLVAAEVIDAVGMRLACDIASLPYPLESPHDLFAVLEVADGGSGQGFVASVLENRDVVVGLDASEIERLWQYRERQSEAFSSLGVIHKLDVSVPLGRLAACAQELREVVGAFPDVQEYGVFGHLADGNIHVEIAGPEADDMSVDVAVLECISRYGGSISAEHGIGRAKVEHLGLSRTPEEIAAMRALKAAWDGRGLMNPGVLLNGKS
jgi:FAD/FMN-containing dehydrogenase